MKQFFYSITFLFTIIVLGCSDSNVNGSIAFYDNPDNFWVDPHTHCLIDKSYLNSDDPSVVFWSGECINGYAIGIGRLTWFDKNDQESFHITCIHPENPQAKCVTGGSINSH